MVSPSERSAVILGGSVAGAAAAIQLSRAGWTVTVVDPELSAMVSPGERPTPRPGAPHAVQAHGFGSRSHVELVQRMPDVWEALLAAGAQDVSLEEMIPPVLYDGGRAGDEDITAMRVRRHTFDRVLGETLAAATVRRVATKATGLLLDEDGPVPRVRGLELADGTTVSADVTIDAGGRRSPVTGWLRAAGIDQPERFDESIARYYTRHYRVVGDQLPLNVGFADVHPFTCHVQLMFLGDNATAMIAMAAHDEDPVLKLLRHPDAFDAVLAANGAFGPWHAILESDSEVHCLGAFDNRIRALVTDGRPMVLGLHQAGDSLAMTNPTRGRGVAMGLLTVGRLVDLLTEGLAPTETALAFEAWRQRTLLPYYRECALTDSMASTQMRAGLAGKSVPNNAPDIELPEGHPISPDDLERAAGHDPDLFRVLLRASVMLDDDRHVASAEVVDRVRRVLATAPPSAPPSEQPTGGLHDRAYVEKLLAPWA